MAEFCLECRNRLNGRKDTEKKYKMSADLDQCEGCGQWKRVIVCERKPRGLIDFLFDMHKKAVTEVCSLRADNIRPYGPS